MTRDPNTQSRKTKKDKKLRNFSKNGKHSKRHIRIITDIVSKHTSNHQQTSKTSASRTLKES